MNTDNRAGSHQHPPHPLIVLLWLMLLTGCASSQVPAGTEPLAPTQVSMPTTVLSSSSFEGLSKGLDNATQARIRATSAVMDTPNVDVYINGLPAFNGGKAQQNIAVGIVSGWLYVTPGTYTVALVPHARTLTQALLAPVAVNAVAGHRYTIVAMGQVKDQTVKPLVVDETALETSSGAQAIGNSGIVVHNLMGVTRIDRSVNGTHAMTVKWGEAQESLCRNGTTGRTIHEVFTVSDKPDSVLAAGDFACGPTVSSLMSWYGTYPGNVIGSNDSQGTSETPLLEFLAGFSAQYVATDDGHVLTFKTLLAAIDTAGMRDQFAASEPYFFIAPTDEAFAALPKAQRDALLTDPQALATLLKAHSIDGYYPSGSLSGATYGEANRAVTNRLGQKLNFVGDTVNGHAVGPNYTVGNGNRMQVIYTLLPVK